MVEFNEESEGWTNFIEEAVKDSGLKARQEAFSFGLSILVAKNGADGYGLYYDHPDGTTSFHKHLEK